MVIPQGENPNAPVIPLEQRVEMLKALRCVDIVRPYLTGRATIKVALQVTAPTSTVGGWIIRVNEFFHVYTQGIGNGFQSGEENSVAFLCTAYRRIAYTRLVSECSDR